MSKLNLKKLLLFFNFFSNTDQIVGSSDQIWSNSEINSGKATLEFSSILKNGAAG